MNLGALIKTRLLVKPPGWVRKLAMRTVWRIPHAGRELFITFDDGPVPELTPWVLDELKRHGARATFFCVGDNVRRHPEIFQRILQEGHAVGNHTYSHLNGYRTGIRPYIRDVYRAHRLVRSGLMRPPYGRIRPVAKRLLATRFQIILWDVLSMDYDPDLNPEEVLGNVIREARPGSIVVFHDNQKASANLRYSLPLVLDHFTREGYKFLPLSEVLT
jgi:peptidoglycan/xylan/chitin deacetylase (PgdA/CDA1 family)